MCGRYTLRDPKRAANAFLRQTPENLPEPRFNVGPGLPAPAIRASSREGGAREWVDMLWGLVPSWAAKDDRPASAMVNARSETVARKPSFRSAFQSRRCILPADGFYEWKRENRPARPYYFHLRDDAPFALAGIWETWERPDSEAVATFCLITTGADALMGPIHHRMPVILAAEQIDAWLDPGNKDPDRLGEFFRPWSPETMEVYPVDPWVNKAGNEGPRCIEPWRGEEQGELPL